MSQGPRHLTVVSLAISGCQIVDLYLDARAAANDSFLDGAGQRPQWSLRTLARALEYALAAMPAYGLQRALYDGFCMTLVTMLQVGAAIMAPCSSSTHFPSVLSVRFCIQNPRLSALHDVAWCRMTVQDLLVEDIC
jgi:midasin (ATPase involved in ribosome maturation)